MGRLISPARPSLWQFGASWPRNKTNALPQTNYDYGYRCYSRLPSRFPSSPSVSISSEHLRAMKPALRMPLCALRKAHHGGANRPLGEMDGSRWTSMGCHGMPSNHGDFKDFTDQNDQNDQTQGISWPEPADIPMYHPVVSGDTMLTCRFLQ